MSKNKLALATLGLTSVFVLAACGKSNTATEKKADTAAKKFSVVQISDGGSVDDKSFNQSAWEGLQKWGKETGRSKGTQGFDYIQPQGEKDYANVVSNAVRAKYDLIFGVGFQLEGALNDASPKYADSKFVSVDGVLKDAKNTASLVFAEHESAFLAGVAAAKTTKTKHVGYIGGVQMEVLIRFESGFVAGVASVDKSIKVDRQYVGGFADAPKGKILANTMYASGADVIYAAAGASGLGVFSAASEAMIADESKQLWVIGVDMDQHKDGVYKTKSGQEKSVTLTSTLKKVGDVMVQFIKATEKDGFKNGVIRYALKDGGVDLTDGQLTAEVKSEVSKVKQDIISGKVSVPKTYEELEKYLAK